MESWSFSAEEESLKDDLIAAVDESSTESDYHHPGIDSENYPEGVSYAVDELGGEDLVLKSIQEYSLEVKTSVQEDLREYLKKGIASVFPDGYHNPDSIQVYLVEAVDLDEGGGELWILGDQPGVEALMEKLE